MKKQSMLLVLSLLSLSSLAEIPQGYYDRLEGLCGVSLMHEAKSIVRNHKVVSYGDDTWNAFRSTDVCWRNGVEVWWDMYSDNTVAVSTGHGGLNIEHSVPNSWWNKTKNDAYKDLYHLNPSDATANNRKGNYPLSEIATVTWDNGVTFVGKPVSGQGGGATLVFEPLDIYKGDFARAYMYIFTVYNDMNWLEKWDWMYDCSSELLLRPWASELLIKWSEEDPVDQKESDRQEAVAAIQKNRNPFIDYPDLAEHIWGVKNNLPWHASGAVQTVSVPVFPGYDHTSAYSYTGTWWDAFNLRITSTEGTLMYSLDGAPYAVYPAEGVAISAAETSGQTHIVYAKAVKKIDGEEKESPVATLTLTARDPSSVDPDPFEGKWILVRDNSSLESGAQYILLSSEADGTAMSYNITKTYFEEAGRVAFNGSDTGTVTSIPEDAAVVTLAREGSEWKMQISTPAGVSKGYLSSTVTKTVTLADNASASGTSASISVASDGVASISFGGNVGSLYYNKSAHRFTTYTSTGQLPLNLYKLEKPTVDILPVDQLPELVAVSGGDIIAPEGSEIFDVNGRRVGFSSLLPGIYIVRTPKTVVKILVR